MLGGIQSAVGDHRVAVDPGHRPLPDILDVEGVRPGHPGRLGGVDALGERPVEPAAHGRRDLPPRDAVPREDLLAVEDEEPRGVVADRLAERVEEPPEELLEVERAVELVRDADEEPVPLLRRQAAPRPDSAPRRRVHARIVSGVRS